MIVVASQYAALKHKFSYDAEIGNVSLGSVPIYVVICDKLIVVEIDVSKVFVLVLTLKSNVLEYPFVFNLYENAIKFHTFSSKLKFVLYVVELITTFILLVFNTITLYYTSTFKFI